MNLLVASVFTLGVGLLLWAGRQNAFTGLPVNSTIVAATQPWEYEGVTYKTIHYDSGQVDLVARIGEKAATLRYQSVTDLTLLGAVGDPSLIVLAREHAAKRGSLEV